MAQKMNRLLWILLIILIPLGLVWQFYPLPDSSIRMNQLPLKGEGFFGMNLPLTEFERKALPNVGIVKRLYKVGGTSYFVSLLDGTRNRHAVHDPEYCFRGDGWIVLNKTPFKLPHGEGSLFLITKMGIEREALVWFSANNIQFPSPMQYWIKTSLRRLTLGRWGEEPLLIIVQPVDVLKPNWDQFIKLFPPLMEL